VHLVTRNDDGSKLIGHELNEADLESTDCCVCAAGIVWRFCLSLRRLAFNAPVYESSSYRCRTDAVQSSLHSLFCSGCIQSEASDAFIVHCDGGGRRLAGKQTDAVTDVRPADTNTESERD